MLIENKSSSYPAMNTRKRELCASYNQLPFIGGTHPKRKKNSILWLKKKKIMEVCFQVLEDYLQ